MYLKLIILKNALHSLSISKNREHNKTIDLLIYKNDCYLIKKFINQCRTTKHKLVKEELFSISFNRRQTISPPKLLLKTSFM